MRQRLESIAIPVAVMMVVVMVMMVVIVARRHHDDARPIVAVVMVVVMIIAVVVVMMVIIILRYLDVIFPRLDGLLLLDRLQNLDGIRDRLEQFGVRIDFQCVRRLRCGSLRGLRGI